MDIIFIRDLRIDTVIGIYDWERAIKQTLSFDLEMATDIARSAASDNIDDTLKMLDVYVQAGGKPERYIIQSWYSYPETIAPETAAYSMTALVKAAMQKLHQVK